MGLLTTCVSVLIGLSADVGMVEDKMTIQIKDSQGAVLHLSELKGSFSGTEWKAKCKQGKCGIKFDLADGQGVLEYKTKDFDLELDVSCQ